MEGISEGVGDRKRERGADSISGLRGPEAFRHFLAYELERRKSEDAKYSLRAFARSLKTEASFLSKILHGKRRVTEATVAKWSECLRLEPELTQAFLGPRPLEESSSKFKTMAVDQFQLISNWYHFAILELIELRDFQPDPKWVADKLGIEQREVLEALERLERLGCLRVEERAWVNTVGSLSTVGNNFTHLAFRKLQKQILKQAIRAMDEVPLDERDQSSVTLAVDSRRLGEAKKRLREFRRELADFLSGGEEKDKVFQLSLSLFPITQKEREPLSD